MARRRRVGNLLALAVLSALFERPMHPYELASVLRERGKDRDMAIKWGSLYTVVDNLAKHALIEAVGSSREGARPERTVYAITEEGRAELVDWVRELVGEPEHERSRFVAGLSLLAALPPDEGIDLLGRRLGSLDRELVRQRASLEYGLAGTDRLFLLEAEYEIAVRAAEADWLRALLDELRSGTFPNLAGWRAWHEGS